MADKEKEKKKVVIDEKETSGVLIEIDPEKELIIMIKSAEERNS